MATIDELFDTISDETRTTYEELIIDAESRRILVPDAEEIFGVESDTQAERKHFRCPRYVGAGLDLASCFIRVNFRNANGEVDSYLVEDVTIDGNDITFSWELSRKVTAYKGQIQFVVCAIMGAGLPEWNTTIAIGVSLEGLEPDTSTVEAETSDVVAQLLATVAAQTGKVQDVGAAQATAVWHAGDNAAKEAEDRIEAKGAAILSTIPVEYTTMDTEVARLGNEKADAYMVTTEAAVSHEIHAQSGVLQLELQGVTYRTGTGDPAPDNVRPIIGLGSYDAVVVLDGTENWVAATTYAANTCRLETTFSGGLCKAGTCSHFASLTPATLNEGVRGAYMLETAKLFVNYGTVAELKAYLADQYAAGTPVTIWYQKSTHDKSDPYYVRAEVEDAAGSYRSVGAKVGTAPLFDGDKVETWVRSGCDVKIVLDGTEAWHLDDNGTPCCPVTVKPASKNRVSYSNLYECSERCPKAVPRFNCAGTSLYVAVGNTMTLEEWVTHLQALASAGTPWTVWYRSADYTPDKDLRICKVTRGQHRLVLDGTEGWALISGQYYAVVGVFPAANTSHAGLCSHGPYKYDYAGGYLFMGDNVLYCSNILTANYATVDAWTAYLAEQAAAGTPITIVYQLATPEVYAFDPAALRSLHSLPETVKASGPLSVTYPQDTNYTIQQLVAAIRELGGTI